jgi:hypothetical protein
MKLILTICLSLTTILFNSCTVCSCKKVPCSAFSDTIFSRWFPYNTGDEVIFQSTSGSDTVSLYVTKSEAYEASQGCFGASSGCSAGYCQIYSNELSSSYSKKLHVEIFDTSPKNISLTFYQFNCQGTDIADTGMVLIDTSSYSKYYPSFNIGGKTFSNVQLIAKDTTASNTIAGPYKIFLVKNTGIVAYETYPDLALWIKQ